MTTHANTLFVQTQGAYLSQDGETVRVKIERQIKLTVPLHHLEGIVCFGRVTVSPSLIAKCAQRGLSLAYFTQHGRFVSRMQGPISGNVLLRREQYRRADDPAACLCVVRAVVAAKIQNTTSVTRARTSLLFPPAHERAAGPCRNQRHHTQYPHRFPAKYFDLFDKSKLGFHCRE